MAKEVDLETPFEVETPEKTPGHIANLASNLDTAPKPDFNPMRRKLDLKSALLN
jgi:hypothetical protein